MGSDVVDQANVRINEWHAAEKRWSLSLGSVPGVRVLALHVDGQQAAAEDWQLRDDGIIWKGASVDDPERAYVTVRIDAKRSALSDAKLALLGTVAVALIGAGGAWINHLTDGCPAEREAVRQEASAAQNVRDQCKTSVRQLTTLCMAPCVAEPGTEQPSLAGNGAAPK